MFVKFVLLLIHTNKYINIHRYIYLYTYIYIFMYIFIHSAFFTLLAAFRIQFTHKCKIQLLLKYSGTNKIFTEV